MTINKQLIGLIFIGLIIAAGIVWQNQKAAPDVSFTTITGKKIDLAKLQGKPVIVTFWATDCPGCIKEMPHLIELYQQFHPKGLEIIAVTMYYDIPSHVVAMAKAKQLPYDIALDLSAEHARAFGQVELTPSTFLISPTGNIVMKTTGLFNMIDIKQLINKLLKG
jgi:peroxiredoxin